MFAYYCFLFLLLLYRRHAIIVSASTCMYSNYLEHILLGMSTSEYSAAGTAGKWYIQVELYQSAIPRKHGCSVTWKHI